MLNITCSSNKKSSHYAFIDYLRGIAILLMFVYHFCFDLSYFKFIDTDFYTNPFWMNFRTFIVSLFLWLVGVSLWLATNKGINQTRYLKRLTWLALATLAVSLSSYIMFAERYIFFGILHFILLASIVGLLFIRFYYLNLLLGLALIILGTNYAHPLFNHDALQWFGLMPSSPQTEDYAPFVPWFGVVLLGVFSSQYIFKYKHFRFMSQWQGNSAPQRLIRCMGQHSLVLYLIHQPIFMGILFLFSLMFA